MTATATPLTESGMGAVLDADDDLAALGSRVRDAALEHGCALVRGLDLDEPRFQSLVHAIGALVDHKFGEGKADLLKLDASREPGKVVTGRGMLPLHTDGLLVGERTDLIVLYARRFADEPGSGETFVCDQLGAWAQMPERLRAVLDAAGSLEYLVEERGYFPSVPEDWYPIGVVRDYGRVRSLNLALAFAPDATARGWQVRVPGLGAKESDAFLGELDAYLSGSRYTYQHRWTEGDLLVIDNQRTLHGRTAIGEGGVRVLFRGQIRL
ncbi:MAG TPA: TauD/TfdA family dioxygenase [Actinocrinis sp.]|uniref:TauD/TfdA family dioxygenase n=1 Tax=Actinocrinis sp. TaxID=1920516 RepID=UPI002DDCE403|nr:TauD/TfdA family dioxygenase [Actinocrinis sp.]HEV2347487.1 TauD/TfdA family dioxygenase [Actinocrinis sp.]